MDELFVRGSREVIAKLMWRESSPYTLPSRPPWRGCILPPNTPSLLLGGKTSKNRGGKSWRDACRRSSSSSSIGVGKGVAGRWWAVPLLLLTPLEESWRGGSVTGLIHTIIIFFFLSFLSGGFFYVSEILGTCKEVRACVHSLGPARDELCEAGREGVTSH